MNTVSFMALVPPILAIVVSLLTKEVNLALFLGVAVGCGLYTGWEFFGSIEVMLDVLSDKVYGNMGVLIFVILLGMIVHLMNMSGATKEYAKWASSKLTTKKQSLIATMFLGMIIFVDDYFNCLTVGTVMRPITDKYKVSREKLAYIIDSTAAPICIIAPISSWAAAVSSSLPDGSSIDGFQLFMKTIVCNYYSWLSLGMVFLTIVLSADFFKMKKYEEAAMDGKDSEVQEVKSDELGRGRVYDLILPVVALIVLSIISMLYTGGYFSENMSIGDAFANCDAIKGLAMGAVYTIFFLALLYLPRKIVTPKQFFDSLIHGFENMVPGLLILVLAWTLSGICGGDYLNAGGYVAQVVNQYNIALEMVPCMFFVVALLLAFSTGTSWGTFAILLPIAVSIFGDQIVPIMTISTAAILGGAVCGDHISPISDTTILSSTGAGCDHLNHVSTQMQYGLLVAGITFLSYIVSGVTQNGVAGLAFGAVVLTVLVVGMKCRDRKS